jgi:hypothetical protein
MVGSNKSLEGVSKGAGFPEVSDSGDCPSSPGSGLVGSGDTVTVLWRRSVKVLGVLSVGLSHHAIRSDKVMYWRMS